MEDLTKKALLKKLQERCKKTKVCPYCESQNGVVKKTQYALKMVHEKYKGNKLLAEAFMYEFEEALKHNEAIRQSLGRVQEDLNPVRVQKILQNISPEDCELLQLPSRPDYMIQTHVVVPPVCIRPSVDMEASGGSNEDDITMKLVQIFNANKNLQQGLEKGSTIAQLMEQWDSLQLHCASLINSELPGLPSSFQPPKPLRGFVQRLKGKQGRFRGNLSGKRVDFSGRTVISPDPNLKVDEVGVPEYVAMKLTYPERVNAYNRRKLQNRILNGMSRHPGAKLVRKPAPNSSGECVEFFLGYGDRGKMASDLKIGDVVDRHLEDGDIVLFNRQPSLHKMSIMAHRVKVMPYRTFRFNECVCTPYNADFDGDEMNLHVPQTEEARAEAHTLMGVTKNLATPKNGEIMVAATQDFLTASYLLTRKDRFIDRAQMCMLCCYMSDGMQRFELPPPAIMKPVELWTGKQLFSLIVCPEGKRDAFDVTLDVIERGYTRKGQHMCPADGYVSFRHGQLISGQLGKKTLGDGNKSGLFSVLVADYGPTIAAKCMNRLAKLSARWLGTVGFSIGIDDVTPGPTLKAEKDRQIEKGYELCNQRIELYKQGNLQNQPGCNAEETLEAEMTGQLSLIREESGKMCLRELRPGNSPLIMAQCGSKGSSINISQMIACVGQQTVSGTRIPNGFDNRTLPHFRENSREPAAKGFVANSFYSGLEPTEFFFHTMAGREGLVDTAVKTAETGYMSRRLMKALEDLSLHYDRTVRSSTGGIVQFDYGDDGLDPIDIEGKDAQSVDLMKSFSEVESFCKAEKERRYNTEMFGMSTTDVAASLPMVPTDAFVDEVMQGILADGGSISFAESVTHFLKAQLDARIKDRKMFASKFKSAKLTKDERSQLLESLAPHITREHVDLFRSRTMSKYRSKRIEPGTAVGAVGAQSIGEPGTQMTLKVRTHMSTRPLQPLYQQMKSLSFSSGTRESHVFVLRLDRCD